MTVTAAASHEHREHIVGVHATTSAALINFFNITSLVPHCFLFGIAQNCVSFSDFFELSFGCFDFFFSLRGVFIWMPNNSLLSVGLLNLCFTSAFIDSKNFVVVFALCLFDLKLGLLDLLLDAT
jgi:ATP/ADP translocase